MTEETKLKIEFAPGAFDQFDGTQEELDNLINEIRQMIESGELLEQSTPVDFDELYDEDPELAVKIAESFLDKPTTRRLN